MAKFTQGVSGPIAGTIGPVVAASWKGKPYLRSRPRKRISYTPQEKQNQSNFTVVHYWLQPLIDFLRIGFKGYSPLVEGFNAAKSYAMKYSFTGEGSNKTLDPSTICVSHGKLPLPATITISKNEDYVIEFTWDVKTEGEANAYDQVMLLAYDNNHKEVAMILTGQFRHVGKDVLELRSIPGYSYHVYAAFISHDRTKQSNSVYLGMMGV